MSAGGRRSPRKGKRYEREIVRRHRELGVEAKRIPLSGAVKGFPGDVEVAGFRGEVKQRSGGKGFLTLQRWLSGNDLLFLRRAYQDPLVLMPWDVYEKLIVAYIAWQKEEAAREAGAHLCEVRGCEVTT